ncbi:Putative Rab-GTPase-TBC domain-containing protein [Septoria linicola]|uniref:Rab-GTPase-TBC domain-containing protein n=1 Tax=Septoria linicola TaxID=215465 RepID=A0A9Q9B4U7_9PEZI|nr:putative Rab-GTPase-TBC domain-containing protein [Septoria linicola]USW56366.1 Putative Rab-GTPase-TBC domain-containing protein [Septoria linicola]
MRYEELRSGLPPRAVRSISDNSTSTSVDTTRNHVSIDEQKWGKQVLVPHFSEFGRSSARRPWTANAAPSSSPASVAHQDHNRNTNNNNNNINDNNNNGLTATATSSTSFDFGFKRDSGIASSSPPAEEDATTTSVLSSREHNSSPPRPSIAVSEGATRHVPAIVVQHEAAERSSRPPFSAYSSPRKPTGMRMRLARSASPPATVKRMASFHGLDVPAVATEDISLEDLASNKVEFSTRGSLLFGGKKMQDIISSQGHEDAPVNGAVAPPPVCPLMPPHKSEADEAVSNGVSKENATPSTESLRNGGTTPVAEKRQGLVAGRRKPSIQMLQAAIHGGRVLSAEEMTFSMKVRSMYEHGDERAANWGLPDSRAMSRATSGKETPDTFTRDTPTPEVVIHKTRSYEQNSGGDNWPLPDNRLSYVSKYSRTSNELAGGIEDWQDVDGYVDRYGFIHQDRGGSSGSSRSRPEAGMQRVATSLRVEADQPRRPRERRLHRNVSSARSSQSLPPPPKDWNFKRGPGSVHSAHSTVTRHSKNPFRSRSTRLLAEASDMLTLPPGLEDIAEMDDSGKTASAQKQREWARGEKWQRMARTVRRKNEGKGGGMHFDFDTADPKLIERTWKGIPDRWRAAAWHSFLSSSAKRRGSQTTDEELIGQFHKLQDMSCADDVQIDVDVPRTVQLHIMFRRRYRGGQRLLFRVLHAMALYFPEVGYVQGMASIAVTLLCYFDEEKAFVMMVRLWQLRGLESFFTEDFSGLMAALAEFEQDWLSNGDVANKLIELGITSTTYGTRWYLTLFNMSVPFPAQLRIWDVFMLLGDAPVTTTVNDTTLPNSNVFGGADLDVLHATSAALIDATRDILLDSDFENAMKVLTSFVPVKDEDILMRVARAEYKIRKKKAGQVKA